MDKKAKKLINIIAGLNEETHEDLIDEIICNSINNGVEIINNSIDEEIYSYIYA